ncbi:MAG: exodeoxyribonuclease VII large subunit [Clostridium sp.]|nr:exodeoxyribonuclease VII large subunit [Clostridium sp.]MCM1547359.1 exodeoxyribonuclease VII large subunit [Ruminococcus sp.]
MIVLTVSQLNKYISFKFKEDAKLKGVIIKGEISNFTAHRSGHFYFTLKDSESAVRAVMFRGNAQRVKFMPEDGMNVIAMGSVSVFERDGVYQVYVTDIQPDGLGALSMATEQLKEKLRKAGIFDESNKRPLPQMPKKIGIVTSPTGAALQDVVNILSRRYPVGELCVFPAVVQGENAPDSICAGIIAAGKADCDVLIVGRGGGSLEDLSAFNTENVAMCIYNSSIPVVSAVGHETDFTVSDLAADMRAPTPSAAAELVSPSVRQLSENIDFYIKRIRNLVMQINSAKESMLERVCVRLSAFSPHSRLEKNEKTLISLERRLEAAYIKKFSDCEREFLTSISKMEAMSPLKVMSRGYSLTYKNKKILADTKNLKIGDNVDIMLAEGGFSASVTEIR